MQPNLNLSLTVDEVNKILMGLDLYQKDAKTLADKIISVAEGQIAEFNRKMQEAQAKTEENQEEGKED